MRGIGAVCTAGGSNRLRIVSLPPRYRQLVAKIARMKNNLLAAHTPCPCGSGETYRNCCGPFHAALGAALNGRIGHIGHLGSNPAGNEIRNEIGNKTGKSADGLHAPTPEALMRSRYGAYVLGLIDYLLATWHPSTAPGELELSPVKWLGLEVLHAQSAGDAGVVEFVARLRDGSGRAQRMHKTSRFVREDGRWYYIDGQKAEA